MLRPIALAAALALSLVAVPALAGGQEMDFEAAAEAYMDLSFDRKAVDGMLNKRRAARPMNAVSTAAPQAALPLEPNSAVAQVTVFRDRAMVTRTRSVTLPAGTHAVTFEGLPPAMIDTSLVASVQGGSLLGVEVVSGTGDVDEEREEALESELQGHLDALGEIQDHIESLLAQRTALRRAVLSQGQDGPPAVREIESLLTYVAQAEERLAKALRTEREKAEELDETIRPLLVKLNDPVATGKTARFDVSVPQGREVTLELRYAVVGARWSPSYDLRYDSARDELVVGFVGVVEQGTGERWEDAPIALSTATPSVGGALPELSPWRVGYDYLDPGLFRLDETEEAVGSPNAETDLIDDGVEAQVSDTGTVVFRIPGSKTIVGDGSKQRLPLGEQRYRVATSLTAAPRAVDRVFREGTVRLGGSVPILAGSTNTYVDGQLVGTGAVQRTLPGESLNLALGTEDALRVARRVVERERDVSGRKHRYRMRFELEVTNPTDAARVVTLRDLAPISEDADIDVRMLDGTTPDDSEDGLLSWTVSVPPGEGRSVSFGFTVVSPDDRRLPSLDALL